MRSREEIEEKIAPCMALDPHYGIFVLLEVLLDIRDLLAKKSPQVKHPDSAEPPKVRST